MSVLASVPDSAKSMNLVHGVADDFNHLVTADTWTTIEGDTGASPSIGDAAGGILTLTTGATDNNECYVHTTAELFLFAADKPIYCEFRMGVVEGNTDDVNLFMGLVNAPAANLLVDNGAGLGADLSAMGFYKVDGETEWRVFGSKSTTQYDELLSATNKNNISGASQVAGTTGPVYKIFTMRFTPTTSTKGNMDWWINETHVAKYFDFDHSSATEMALTMGVKAGGATTEVPKWDYALCYQKR
jgi:hypothetical protein